MELQDIKKDIILDISSQLYEGENILTHEVKLKSLLSDYIGSKNITKIKNDYVASHIIYNVIENSIKHKGIDSETKIIRLRKIIDKYLNIIKNNNLITSDSEDEDINYVLEMKRMMTCDVKTITDLTIIKWLLYDIIIQFI